MKEALILPLTEVPLRDVSLNPKYIQTKVFHLIALSTLIRLFIDYQLELGNDEVYYWTYALYPDWSYFDHPPFVGILAQIFTANLFFKSTFFLRLGSIMVTGLSTWLIYRIGVKVKNPMTGLYAALLFTSSIYCSIIGGFALTPDASLILFWLLALNSVIDILPRTIIGRYERNKMILFGLFTGLAMISKYQAIFLWIGVVLFVLIYNRRWLRDYSFYVAIGIGLALTLPILLWNFQNEFISFSFHTKRITPAFRIRPDYFTAEIIGQILYNNPLNVILLITAFIALMKGRVSLANNYTRILVMTSVPLWLVFTGFSLFRPTFPHWSGPAFLSFIVITAAYWSDHDFCPDTSFKKLCNPLKVIFPIYVLAGALLLMVYVVNYSPFQFGKRSTINFGEYDFTQDMYGWDTIEKSFVTISQREEKNGSMKKNAGLVSFRWFPGAHLDYYVAHPHHRNLFLIGSMDDIHKYAWINNIRGGLKKGSDYYHIAVTNYYRDPNIAFGKYFEKIEPMDTVAVMRSGKVMRYAFFYKLKSYKGNFINPVTNK